MVLSVLVHRSLAVSLFSVLCIYLSMSAIIHIYQSATVSVRQSFSENVHLVLFYMSIELPKLALRFNWHFTPGTPWHHND